MNVDWLSRLPAPARRGLYFSLQRFIGSKIGSVWQELQTWKDLSPRELSEKVDTRLRQALDGAVSQSAYYRKLGPNPSRIPRLIACAVSLS